MARLKRGHGKVIDLTHELAPEPAQELGLALDLGQTPGAGSTKGLDLIPEQEISTKRPLSIKIKTSLTALQEFKSLLPERLLATNNRSIRGSWTPISKSSGVNLSKRTLIPQLSQSVPTWEQERLISLTLSLLILAHPERSTLILIRLTMILQWRIRSQCLPRLFFKSQTTTSSSLTLPWTIPSAQWMDHIKRSRNNHTPHQDTNKNPSTHSTNKTKSLRFSPLKRTRRDKFPRQLNWPLTTPLLDNRSPRTTKCLSSRTPRASSPMSPSVSSTLNLTARTWKRSECMRVRTQESSSRNSESSSIYLITQWRSSWSKSGTKLELIKRLWEASSTSISSIEWKYYLCSRLSNLNLCVKIITI